MVDAFPESGLPVAPGACPTCDAPLIHTCNGWTCPHGCGNSTESNLPEEPRHICGTKTPSFRCPACNPAGDSIPPVCRGTWEFENFPCEKPKGHEGPCGQQREHRVEYSKAKAQEVFDAARTLSLQSPPPGPTALPDCTCWQLDPAKIEPTCPRHGVIRKSPLPVEGTADYWRDQFEGMRDSWQRAFNDASKYEAERDHLATAVRAWRDLVPDPVGVPYRLEFETRQLLREDEDDA